MDENGYEPVHVLKGYSACSVRTAESESGTATACILPAGAESGAERANDMDKCVKFWNLRNYAVTYPDISVVERHSGCFRFRPGRVYNRPWRKDLSESAGLLKYRTVCNPRSDAVTDCFSCGPPDAARKFRPGVGGLRRFRAAAAEELRAAVAGNLRMFRPDPAGNFRRFRPRDAAGFRRFRSALRGNPRGVRDGTPRRRGSTSAVGRLCRFVFVRPASGLLRQVLPGPP